MFKKSISMCLLVIFLLIPLSTTYAGEAEVNSASNEELRLLYVGTSTITYDFSVLNGKASPIVKLIPKSSSSIDSVKVTVKIINSSGKAEKTWNQTLTYSVGAFRFSDSYSLPAKGTYYMTVQGTCYKNNSAIDTFSYTSQKVTY